MLQSEITPYDPREREKQIRQSAPPVDAPRCRSGLEPQLTADPAVGLPAGAASGGTRPAGGSNYGYWSPSRKPPGEIDPADDRSADERQDR